MTETKSTHNQALGRFGERLAEQLLRGRGLVVLDRNWRCSQGEIDLVLREGRTLVVCEVKTRTSNDFGTPHEAVTPVKAQRLQRLAACWLAEHAARPDDVRIDLVAVLVPRRGAPELDHVEGIG